MSLAVRISREERADQIFDVIRQAARLNEAISQHDIQRLIGVNSVATVNNAIKLLKTRGDVVLDGTNRTYRYILPNEGLATQPKSGSWDNAANASKQRRVSQSTVDVKTNTRPCICCGATIQSEGPHHRMCVICRHRDGALDNYRLMPK